MHDDGIDRVASREGCERLYEDARPLIEAGLAPVAGIGDVRWRDSGEPRWDPNALRAGKSFTVETAPRGHAFALRLSGAVYWTTVEGQPPGSGMVDDLRGSIWRVSEADRPAPLFFPFGRKNHHQTYPLRDFDALTRTVITARDRLGGPPAIEPLEPWAERVFGELLAVMGGDEKQTGLERRYGDGNFKAVVAYKPDGDKGGVIFQVSRVGGHTYRQPGPFWRDGSTDTKSVATAILTDFDALTSAK